MIKLTISTRFGNKFWFCNNDWHRANGPAVVRGSGSYWYKNGLAHRTDGPAVVQSNGYIGFWFNGQEVTEYEHMFLTEAMIKVNITNCGSKYWTISHHHTYHRANGPAVVHFDGHTEFWFNGKRHRVSGPAIAWPNGKVEYWVHGNRVTEYEQMFLTV